MPNPTTRKGPGNELCNPPDSLASAKGYFFASGFFAAAAGAFAPVAGAASASVLPFLATSGSPVVAAAAARFDVGSGRHFFTNRDDVGHCRVFCIQELDGTGVGQILYAQRGPKFQVADVYVDVAGNISWQALDLDFTQYLVQNSASRFHTQRHAQQLHADAYPDGLIHGDTLQVDVDELILNGLTLPIDDHGFRGRVARNFDVKNCVMARFREENSGNLLGVHFNGHGILSGTIKHSGDLAATRTRRAAFLLNLPSRGLATTTSGICSLVSWYRAR